MVARTANSAINDGPKDRIVVIAPKNTRTAVVPKDSISSSSIAWSTTTPGPQIIVGRKWMVQVTCTVTPKASAANPPVAVVFTAGADAPSQDPLNAIIANAQISINGSSVDQARLNEVMPVIHSRMSPSARRALSTSPMAPDKCTAFSDLWASNTSPFAAQGSSTEESRAQFPFVAAAGGGRTYTFTAPLRVSPLVDYDGAEGMTNISNIAVNLRLGNLSRIWSHDQVNGDAGWNGVDVTIGDASLFLEYSTPDSSQLAAMPMVQQLSYDHHAVFPASGPTLAAGASATVLTSALSLNALPKTLHLFAHRTDASRTELMTSTLGRIDKISITLKNQSTQVSDKPAVAIFEMSRASGSRLGPTSRHFREGWRASTWQLPLGAKDRPLTSMAAPSRFRLRLPIPISPLFQW